MKIPLDIQISSTPNPQTIKFNLNQKICDQPLEITHIQQAGRSPLGQKLMGFPWVNRILIGQDFVSITKEDWVEWDTLKDPLKQLILDHLKNDVVLKDSTDEEMSARSWSAEDLEIVEKIKKIIDQKIQPFVEQDGGLISFSNYVDGKVYLKLQGACSGCPSASFTLKQGIESILREEIPQVKEVIGS